MKENRFQLVIFDLDGTLVDTLSDITDSANRVLKHLKIKKASKEKVKHAIGSGVDSFFYNLGVKDKNIGFAKKLFTRNYLLNLTKKSKFYPGTLRVLQELKKRKILMYIVSNKAQLFSERLLSELKAKQYFEKIIGINSDEKTRLKPSPYYIRKILKDENIKPKNAVMVGDSKTDLLAAKNAHIYSCAVLYGFRKYGELKKYRPDYCIKKPVELLEIIRHCPS